MVNEGCRSWKWRRKDAVCAHLGGGRVASLLLSVAVADGGALHGTAIYGVGALVVLDRAGPLDRRRLVNERVAVDAEGSGRVAGISDRRGRDTAECRGVPVSCPRAPGRTRRGIRRPLIRC